MPSTDHGTFHWNELITRDVEAAKSFYGESLGWTFVPMAMPDGQIYTLAQQDDQPVGGIMAVQDNMPPDMKPHWMAYIAVDDIDARLTKAKAAGGTVLQEPFEIEGVGRIAMVMDPTGAVIGWITPANPQG